MNIFGLETRSGTTPPTKGKMLIAAPFLNDPNFSRSVVLLCEHGEEGTVGFVLNQPANVTLGDLVAEMEPYMPPIAVNTGGPVQPSTLHILHRIPEKLGGMQVYGDIHWGGSYEVLQDLVRNGAYREDEVRLFLGYSGWSAGQLEKEMKEDTWLVGNATEDLIFRTDAHQVWKKAVSRLGKEYGFIANMPTDPQLN